MDLERIRVYLLAIDTGSLTKAAKLLNYTPSAISHMMHTLEKEAGVPLLNRTNQGVKPTKIAEEFLPEMRELIKQEARLVQKLGEYKGLQSGQLSIGSFTSIAENWLPEIIRDFALDYPNIEIEIYEGIRSELELMLHERRLDFCIYSYQKGYEGVWIPLRKDPIIAVLPKNHPKAHEPVYRWEYLNEEQLILASVGTDSDILNLLHSKNLHPKMQYKTHDDYAALSLIETGLGVGIMNELVTRRHIANIVRLPIEPKEEMELSIAIPSLEKATPVVQCFIRYLQMYM